jgi:hypothetical protein
MNLKKITGLLAVGCIVCSAAFGQTIQITGTVTAVTDTEITLQSGTDVWTIKRTPTTKVTDGTLKTAATVTVQCPSPNAHKNEGTLAVPTATASGQ